MRYRVERTYLENHVATIFEKLGLNKDDALKSSKVLIAADARSIPSHGLGRLWRYKNGLQNGVMQTQNNPEVLRETPVSLVIDAKGAIGMALSYNTMEKVIEKAKKSGICVASVKDSNHYGIAGYYAEMAAKQGLIGISMTNTAALQVPTFSRDVMFGTNPIAFSAPGHKNIFTLDMATTTVTRGKIETHVREGKVIPKGWAVDPEGVSTSNGEQLLDDMLYQRGGGLLPLGGEGELFSGHKGFGLAVLVDILCSVSSGGVFGKNVMDTKETSARVCHFFAAIDINVIRDPEEYKSDIDKLLQEINKAAPAKGCDRVYYHGQKEAESEAEAAIKGVVLSEKIFTQLVDIGNEFGLKLTEYKTEE